MRDRAVLLAAALLLLAALLATAARGVGLLDVIRNYPSVHVENTAGCVLNYDIRWLLFDPRGQLILETPSEATAAAALLVCAE